MLFTVDTTLANDDAIEPYIETTSSNQSPVSEHPGEPGGCEPQTITHQGYTYTIGTGACRIVAATEETDSIISRLPAAQTLSSEEVREAALNDDSTAAEKQLLQRSDAILESNADLNYFLQVCESVKEEVLPWQTAAVSAVHKLSQKLDSLQKHKPKRTGSFAELFRISKVPDLSGVIFYLTVIVIGLAAEVNAGMLNAYLSWPFFVKTKLGYFTAITTSFSLSAIFVFGPFVVLKFIPLSLDEVGLVRFLKTYRLAAVGFCLVGVIVSGWTFSIAKDYPPGLGNAEPPFNPGFLGFIIAAMLLIAVTTTCASMMLKRCVDNLFVIIEEVNRIYLATERDLGHAQSCLSSNNGLLARVDRAIAAYRGAIAVSQTTATNQLAMYQADRKARQMQVDILGE